MSECDRMWLVFALLCLLAMVVSAGFTAFENEARLDILERTLEEADDE